MTSVQPTPTEIRSGLLGPLREIFPEIAPGQIEVLSQTTGVGDDPIKLRIFDARGKPRAFGLCSVPTSPGLVARGMDRAREAKATLEPKYARAILDPLVEGEIGELTFTILPHCIPLSDSRLAWWKQRRQLRPVLCEWLRGVTRNTFVTPNPSEIEKHFDDSLDHLISINEIPPNICAAATRAKKRIANGDWKPSFVLMHGDLWKGNILIDEQNHGRNRAWDERFIVIDWPSATIKGHAMLDLIRLAQSFRFSKATLRDEVVAQCRLLNYPVQDARSALAAALAQRVSHLDHFPMSRFVEMARMCFVTLEAVALEAS